MRWDQGVCCAISGGIAGRREELGSTQGGQRSSWPVEVSHSEAPKTKIDGGRARVSRSNLPIVVVVASGPSSGAGSGRGTSGSASRRLERPYVMIVSHGIAINPVMSAT